MITFTCLEIIVSKSVSSFCILSHVAIECFKGIFFLIFLIKFKQLGMFFVCFFERENV